MRATRTGFASAHRPVMPNVAWMPDWASTSSISRVEPASAPASNVRATTRRPGSPRLITRAGAAADVVGGGAVVAGGTVVEVVDVVEVVAGGGGAVVAVVAGAGDVVAGEAPPPDPPQAAKMVAVTISTGANWALLIGIWTERYEPFWVQTRAERPDSRQL